MSTQEIPVQADFRERAKTNEVPIARLIGFQAKDIADGRATVVLAAGHVLILLFDKVITTIVRPTDRQQILGSVLVETKKARSLAVLRSNGTSRLQASSNLTSQP